ncbi:uncharacterized protein CIMG_09785 [Coccidioides immitis RS]|uniref:Uncharacterized protein n=1 Tax=Coccidioides immitis (strain RS) TaxID=246410 RepID=J3K357_COCIM|nr:uncharacterized protein CIMG_09785 [Coccidioides immitis RS]EAS28581.3 hypothetical protein CIMG_09785 [Coccidioides immitis RS]
MRTNREKRSRKIAQSLGKRFSAPPHQDLPLDQWRRKATKKANLVEHGRADPRGWMSKSVLNRGLEELYAASGWPSQVWRVWRAGVSLSGPVHRQPWLRCTCPRLLVPPR